MINRYVLLGFFTALLSFSHPSSSAQDDIKIPEVLVDSLIIQRQEIQPKLQLPGVVEPLVHGKLTTEVEGIITRARKQLGDSVQRNETILFIKNSQIGYEYKEYAVRAPVSGLVTDLSVTVGQYVKPGDALGNVTNTETMRIIAEVPAVHIHNLRNGQSAEFKLGNLNLKAKVTGVARYVKPKTGTARVELAPEKSESKLVSGSVGDLTIFMDKQEALAIPLTAIVDIGESVYVRKIVDNKVQMQKVNLGVLVGSQRIVLEGLKEGEEIIIQATDHLKGGDPIKRSPPKSRDETKA